MKTASTAFLAVLVISSIGIWGCSQQKCGAQARKIHDLETRYSKLEEDYRTVVSASEGTQRKLVRLETQRVELTQQVEELKVVMQERDELRQKLASRTQERDNVQAQLLQFGKELQNLAHRVEAVAQAGFPGVQATPVLLKN